MDKENEQQDDTVDKENEQQDDSVDKENKLLLDVSKTCQNLLKRQATFEFAVMHQLKDLEHAVVRKLEEIEDGIMCKLREMDEQLSMVQMENALNFDVTSLQTPTPNHNHSSTFNPTRFQSSTPNPHSSTPNATQVQEQSANPTVTVTSSPVNEGMPEVKDGTKALLSPSHISRLRASSVSRENFSTRLVKELFSVEERSTCNVRGVGKPKLNEKKISLVRKMTFDNYPCALTEEKATWSRCVKAIDSSSRALSRNMKREKEKNDEV